ncbi:MAG: hypothetical protein JWO90_426 [Solirubrobacterales bacterium]|jgi:hypothetical protein|nr:hypothetical protein [Solirubrobacterales bacterium]
MTLAVTTGQSVLALLGLTLGLMVLALVLNLLNSVLRAAKEIDAYAKDILTAGLGIATNLDGADHLARTHELGGAVPGLAVRYLRKLGAIK